MNDPKKQYSGEHIANYFDLYGDKEWQRMVANPVNEINLHIHTHYLKEYVRPGDKVLEIGAGPGRFTQILAQIGAQVVVADISPGQLELNKKYAEEHNFSTAVLSWEMADICELNQFKNSSFDRVVAFGGPFSYVLDQRDAALRECLRVLRPGGIMLLSVMSLWGTLHHVLLGILNDIPADVNRKVVATGDLIPETYDNEGHYMHMYRAAELQDWLVQAGTQLLAISSCNSLSSTRGEQLTEIRQDKEKWDFLLELEQEACAQPGALDMGTHILAVVKKRAKGLLP
jgi:2-polyprenyl-3-methyl-5-hydroxy-6-metoxy-1,4-benzoquinol methylase